MQKHEKRENLVYLGLWLLLFLSPVINMYIRTVNSHHGEMMWDEVFNVWKVFLVYLVIFLIHNFLLAPLLIYKKRRLAYLSVVICMLAAFQLYQCSHRPDDRHESPMHEHEWEPMHDDSEWDRMRMEPHGDIQHGPFRPDEGHRPPMFMGQHDVIAFVVIFLMLGMNLGVKLYFKSLRDSKVMDDLRSKSLEQQLEYLKYQINPHFFMNTLNNIHALVDIDPEKAKDTILELSKLMRYVLYEGAKNTVPLQHEVAFLNNYITLMKIRYTDKVRIEVDVPQSMPDKSVPPLLFITFVENAFKHGVSYQKVSFIEVKLLIEGERVKFVCRNSKIDERDDEHGGVGLVNVRKRLDLIYDRDYTLDITDETDVYDVRLSIPLLSNT